MSDNSEIPKESVKSFMDRVNSSYSGAVIKASGTSHGGLVVRRFSSGILSLDCALGGGWPFSRIALVAGEESTGKTLLTLKAAETIQDYDTHTHLHRSRVQSFEPCKTLFVDVEHSFDEIWAKAHGWSSDNAIVQPETAEQAIDITTEAIRANLFDLIIVDSIAALTPSKEIEESSEDFQVGLGARLTNKAFRRWTASLSRASQDFEQGGPALMCLNQFRLKVGINYGDPRVLPHGKGQRFAAAIIVYTKAAEVKDNEQKEHGTGTYSGIVFKNKTYIPRINYKFGMTLKDTETANKGIVDNLKQLEKLGKQYNVITKREKGSGWRVGSDEFKTLTEIRERAAVDPEFKLLLWRSVVKAFGGSVV
jgi:recombination protein RecA